MYTRRRRRTNKSSVFKITKQHYINARNRARTAHTKLLYLILLEPFVVVVVYAIYDDLHTTAALHTSLTAQRNKKKSFYALVDTRRVIEEKKTQNVKANVLTSKGTRKI